MERASSAATLTVQNEGARLRSRVCRGQYMCRGDEVATPKGVLDGHSSSLHLPGSAAVNDVSWIY